jgi:hypothetical protein
MKTTMLGIVSAAILMVVAGIGFGIAQAAETHADRPVLDFEDQGTLEQGISSNSYLESRPVLDFGDQELIQVAKSPQEFIPEGNWSGTDWQARVPVETGAIPGTLSEEPWMRNYGQD